MHFIGGKHSAKFSSQLSEHLRHHAAGVYVSMREERTEGGGEQQPNVFVRCYVCRQV